jgi:hypothetical protein
VLDLSVGNFHLATRLRMVGSGYFVCDGIFKEQGLEKSVAKVLTSVTNDGTWGTESAENVGLDEFDHNLVIISLGSHSLDPFRDIIHSYKNILKPKRWREGSHEVDNPNVKDFNN